MTIKIIKVFVAISVVLLLVSFAVIARSGADGWKDVQGRTAFRVLFINERKHLIVEPMTSVRFVLDRVDGNRAILPGDVFQECYFDVLHHEVDPDPRKEGDVINRITLGLRCKDHVFHVTSVGVPIPPPRKERP